MQDVGRMPLIVAVPIRSLGNHEEMNVLAFCFGKDRYGDVAILQLEVWLGVSLID